LRTASPTFGDLGAFATDRFGTTSSRQRMSPMGRFRPANSTNSLP